MLSELNSIKTARTFVTSLWQQAAIDPVRYGWIAFMSMLTMAVFIFSWSGLNLPGSLFIVICMSLLGWSARQWPAMQVSVMVIVLLSCIMMLTKTASLLSGYFQLAMTVLLAISFVLAVVVEMGKTKLTHLHVSYLCWSVIVCGSLLLISRGLSLATVGLHYGRLPLMSVGGFLILTVLLIVFNYLLFERTHARLRASFIGLLPAVLMGFYITAYLSSASVSEAVMPDVILEHGLLLVHVPAMIVAFALLMSAAGFAALRLFSDSPWLKLRDNQDVLETVQTRLEDYLHRLLALAIIIMGVGLVTGMAWSSLAWGHYWQAEPTQLMSLAVWLYYLAGLHFRLQKGMQTRPFAWWCVAGLPLLLLSLPGTNLWPQGLHSFGNL